MSANEPNRAALGSPSRRRFLKAVAASLCASAGAVGWATCLEPHWVEVVQHTLVIPNLPPHWVNKRIVHLSDFHIGATDAGYLMQTLDRVNELEPDVLALTGDFIDRSFPNAGDEITRIFDRLQPARVATIGCLGNHDYGQNWNQQHVADAVVVTLEKQGIQILRHEALQIDGLNVFGLDDYWSPRYRRGRDLQFPDPEQSHLCLCHNPDVCDNESFWEGFEGVILAGHTHGGQCKAPFMQPPRLPVDNKRYVAGFYDVGAGRKLYINRGLGYGLKARFNCRPEVTVFTLAVA